MSAEQSDSSHNCGDSAVLLSVILQEGTSYAPENPDGDRCDANSGVLSETQDLDEMLDGLLEYHEKLENDRVDGCRGRVFQTELPTILESQTSSPGASQYTASEASLLPDPTYNPNNIYNPNFTVLLTEKKTTKLRNFWQRISPLKMRFGFQTKTSAAMPRYAHSCPCLFRWTVAT